MRRVLVVLVAGLLVVAGFSSAAPQAEGASAVKVCGSGNGHGVGLSQYGAYGRAEAGQGYAQILKAYYPGAHLERFAADPFVRVLLGTTSFGGKYDVAASSGAYLKNLATGGVVSLNPGTYRVKYLRSQKLYRITNLTSGRQVGSYTGPVVFKPVSGGLLDYGGKSYRGTLLAKTSGTELYLINRLRMEDYIRGVVPEEMPYSWAPAALESQAVAARSFAWSVKRGGMFDFYGDYRDQVYGGASSETATTNRAVAATARVYAVYGGSPIEAFFYSSDGGYTEDSSYVFGPSPYLKAIRDVDSQGRPYEALAGSPWTHWSGTLDPNGSPQLGVGAITGVRVLSRSPSGRATKVEVIGSQGKKILSGEYSIRFNLKTTGLVRADGSGYPAGYLPSARVSFGASCGG